MQVVIFVLLKIKLIVGIFKKYYKPESVAIGWNAISPLKPNLPIAARYSSFNHLKEIFSKLLTSFNPGNLCASNSKGVSSISS